MDPNDPVFRLEQALRLWEDRCFIFKMKALYQQAVGQPCDYAVEGPLKHGSGFRKFLLGITHESDYAAEVAEKFILPVTTVKRLGKLWSLPNNLVGWTLDSRRVFRLSLDLQAMLNATSLDGVLWKDVMPPFGTFMLALPSPIKDDGGREYDAVLFHRSQSDDSGDYPEYDALMREKGIDPSEAATAVSFTLLPRALGDVTPISSFEREHILAGLRKKDWKKMRHWINKAAAKVKTPPISSFGFLDERVAEACVTDSIRDMHTKTHATTCTCGRPHPEWDAAARLFVGVCIYLASLPSGPTPERSDWTRSSARDLKPMSLMSEAQICTVTSSHVLTAEERAAFLQDGRAGQGGYEVSSHFRRGHYRRPKGKGDDPTALKVVWVRPTIVRRDRLKDGVLPLSGVTVMK